MKAMICSIKHFSLGMTWTRVAICILCIPALLAVSARIAGARQHVEIIPLPVDAVPMRINNRGQIAGAFAGNGPIKLFVYTNRSLKILPIPIFPGAEGSVPTGVSINDKGDIAASMLLDRHLYIHAFIWRHGKASLLKSVGSRNENSYAQGINNRGEVVGEVASGNFNELAPFVWSTGTASHFAYPASMFAVNDQGEIVGDLPHRGSYRIYSHPAAWIHGHAKDLGLPRGSTDATALALNNHGFIVGYAIFPTSAKAKQSGIVRRYLPCVWGQHGAQQLPSFEGSSSGMATAVNSFGEIVGVSELAYNNVEKAVLWKRSKMLDLNNLLPHDAHWLLARAYSINDKGDIVGTGVYRGKTRGYLLRIAYKLREGRFAR